MKYQLYGRRQSGSMAIEPALAICGAEWEFILTPRPKTDEEKAAFLAINPRGQVPVLIHPDGTVITEGPAMLAHLADAFPASGLAPAPGSSARATQDRWMAFFQANIYEGMLRELAPGRYTTDADGTAGVLSAATDYVRRHFLIFEAEVAKGNAAFGTGGLSALDIYVWMLCFWMDATWLADNCPVLNARWQGLRPHPVLQPVEQSHFG